MSMHKNRESYIHGKVKYSPVKNSGVAELADASAVHPRDPGSNLSRKKIFSNSICVTFETKSVGC
jgi:hypothetical protein